jgi:hypothetical protein
MSKSQTDTPNTTDTCHAEPSAKQQEPARGTLEWFDWIEEKSLRRLEEWSIERRRQQAVMNSYGVTRLSDGASPQELYCHIQDVLRCIPASETLKPAILKEIRERIELEVDLSTMWRKSGT